MSLLAHKLRNGFASWSRLEDVVGQSEDLSLQLSGVENRSRLLLVGQQARIDQLSDNPKRNMSNFPPRRSNQIAGAVCIYLFE